MVQRFSFKKIAKLFLIAIGIFVAFIVLVIGYLFFIAPQLDKIKEEKIDKRFHEELKTLPTVTVKSFHLWEGDSIDQIYIKNKGEVNFWYGEEGIPSIEDIGGITTSVTCYYTDFHGKKIRYVHDMGMIIVKGEAFAKWFPFEVKSLHDLVARYDHILRIVKTFPHRQAQDFMPFLDGYGSREVLKHSDPQYTIKGKFGSICDVYIRE